MTGFRKFRIADAGYPHTAGLKADDGHWEWQGVKNGKIMEFQVDPRGGAPIKEGIDG